MIGDQSEHKYTVPATMHEPAKERNLNLLCTESPAQYNYFLTIEERKAKILREKQAETEAQIAKQKEQLIVVPGTIQDVQNDE